MRAILLAAVLGGTACGAAPRAGVTEEQVERLKEANRIWAAGTKAWEAGERAAALSLLHKAAKVEALVIGPWHRQTEMTADSLGDYYQAAERWEDEARCRQTVIEARCRLDGPGHHRTVDARKELAEALAQAKRTPAEREALRRAFNSSKRAEALRREGKAAMALPLAREALALRLRVLGPRHPEYADSLHSLATLHRDVGGHTAALPHARQALAVYKEALGENHPAYANALNNLAQLHKAMGDYGAALPLLEKVTEIRKAAFGEGHPDHAAGLTNLASLHQDMGRHRTALLLYKRALSILMQASGEEHAFYAVCLNNLATLCQDMGDYKAALTHFRRALELARRLHGDGHPSYATSLNNLAVLYQTMGEPKAALPLSNQARAIIKGVMGERHPHHAYSLQNHASLCEDLGDHDAALSHLKRATQIIKEAVGERHPTYATCLNSLASLHKAKGRHEAALTLHERALQIIRDTQGEGHPHYADSLHSLARLHLAAGDREAALRRAEKALALTVAHLYANASVQSDRQQLAAASDLRHCLDIRLSIPDGPRHPPACAHALAWKGAILLRQQHRRLFLRLAADDTTKAAAKRLLSATRQLAALRHSPGATREELEGLAKLQEEAQAELAGLSTAFGAQREKGRVSPEALAASLPEGAVLVDYLFFARPGLKGKGGRPREENHLVAFLHRKGESARRVDLGPAERVENAVQAWRPLLTSGKAGHAAGLALKALVWAPLERHIEGAKVVLVSPDGVLGTVSFAALPGKKEGTYLIEDAAVAVVPVPSAVPELMRPVDKASRLRPSLLLAGDIRYEPGKARPPAAGVGTWSAPRTGRETFAALPATAAETRAVRSSFEKAFDGGEAISLRGGEATKSAVGKALASVRYAHLATHGYFAPETVKNALSGAGHARTGVRRQVTGWPPLLLSGLALSDANRDPGLGEEDGILTALEVSEMDLTRLELAVLSACETGLGAVAGGEGVLGMQRAFQIAGARSVVSSMWKVSDEATRVLMSRFYENLWGKGMGRLEALVEAQRWMLREGHAVPGVTRGKVGELLPEKGTRRLPPYYWAAFVLSGDWR